MRPTGGRPGGRRDGPDRGGSKFRRPRRRVCAFCADKIDSADYKNAARLRRYVSDRGKILPRRATGNCAKHQRMIMHAIKRAREIALLPFTAE
ncbi:MAG: 30S ribosomal protein S18 [Armatimonadetes bacterium]|nr:30S ribosomal protein S18 [Armatimonadota bacterium]